MKKIGSTALNRTVVRQAEADGVTGSRLKKWVAATALFQLFRYARDAGILDTYYVKGGFSVELRHPWTARTSEDIDLVIAGAKNPVNLLEQAIAPGWSDFEFKIKSVAERPHAIRVEIYARFNNNDWCTLKIDLLTEPAREVEEIEPLNLVQFGSPQAAAIPCLSRAHQMAQWIHCITKPEVDGKRVDRARNVVDLYLFDTQSPCEDSVAAAATVDVFEREATHAWPPEVDIPEQWLESLEHWVVDLNLPLSARELVEYFHRYIVRLMGVAVNLRYDYRFYVLMFAGQRKPLLDPALDPVDTDLFTEDQSLTSFRRAIADGFRIILMNNWERVGGVIVVLERPQQ